MKNIEERLQKLEELSNAIKDPSIPLEDAINIFDEGIKLVRGMEKDLDKMEGKIQMLMNQPASPGDKCELDLFSQLD